jgi:sugar phosphate isomerase/epimerase
MVMTTISISADLLPAGSLAKKWDLAHDWGCDALTLSSRDVAEVASTISLLREAVALGIPVSTIMVDVDLVVSLVDVDGPAQRRLVDLVREANDAGIAEIVVAPNSVAGDANRRSGSASTSQDRLTDALVLLVQRTTLRDCRLCLQAANRYISTVNTLADSAAMAAAVGLPLAVSANTFHMNMEEADPAKSLLECAGLLGHLHAVDSTGGVPGSGQVDWPLIGATLHAMSFRGSITIGGIPDSEPQSAIPAALNTLRRFT